MIVKTLLVGCLARISSDEITLPLCYSQNKEKEVGHARFMEFKTFNKIHYDRINSVCIPFSDLSRRFDFDFLSRCLARFGYIVSF